MHTNHTTVPSDSIQVIDTKEGIARYQLAALRAAIKLEGLGMRHSSGRSATAHAKKMLGLPRSATRTQVIEAISCRLASE